MSSDLDPVFVKALKLLQSRSKDSYCQLKQMYDEVVAQRRAETTVKRVITITCSSFVWQRWFYSAFVVYKFACISRRIKFIVYVQFEMKCQNMRGLWAVQYIDTPFNIVNDDHNHVALRDLFRYCSRSCISICIIHFTLGEVDNFHATSLSIYR